MNDEMLAQVQRASCFQVLNGSDRGFPWRRNSELEKKAPQRRQRFIIPDS